MSALDIFAWIILVVLVLSTVAVFLAIVPDVAGEVIDVPVTANQPLKAGDALFRIGPVPFQAQVSAIEAQLKFQQLRLAEMTQLRGRGHRPQGAPASGRDHKLRQSVLSKRFAI